jgi:hypothetical protein
LKSNTDIFWATQEIRFDFHHFYPVCIDNGNFVIFATVALSPAMTADLNLFQNAGKSVSANALNEENQNRA